MNIQELANQVLALWSSDIESHVEALSGTVEFCCGREQVPGLCGWLFNQQGYHFSGLVVEEGTSCRELFYLFVGQGEQGRVQVKTRAALGQREFASVSVLVHPADWHERVAEDLYGLVFTGHPHRGDGMWPNAAWQEGVEPMREGLDPECARSRREPGPDWRPRRAVEVPGSFIMPIGPVFSGVAEAVHFQLETIGEEIISAYPRLFFKYRGVEKRAPGRPVADALLLAERFAGTTAFSHALAFCLAVEQCRDSKPSERAQVLRCFFAELERLRSHLGMIEGICNATGLAVAANQVAILEEQLLRLAGSLIGHRYLFGLVIPGGLSRDCDDQSLQEAMIQARKIVGRLDEIERLLSTTSSFLDRLEEVGIISTEQARIHGLVGPLARGSGYGNDLRRLQPYAAYARFAFETVGEQEGDGYARLRVFFAEARQSLRIMEQAVEVLPSGPYFTPGETLAGVALAGTETPRGTSWHWLRITGNTEVKHYRLITPSFANWYGFHLAVENYAFQDFPIILATLGLSVAENDR